MSEARQALLERAEAMGFLAVVEGPAVAWFETPGGAWQYDTLGLEGITLGGDAFEGEALGEPVADERLAIAALLESLDVWATTEGTYGKVLVIRVWPETRKLEGGWVARMRCAAVPQHEWQARPPAWSTGAGI